MLHTLLSIRYQRGNSALYHPPKVMNDTTTNKIDAVYSRYYDLMVRYELRPDQIQDRLDMEMDMMSIEEEGIDMDFDALLEADNANFLHDVCGIINNLDRTSFPAKLGNCFLPRFAK